MSEEKQFSESDLKLISELNKSTFDETIQKEKSEQEQYKELQIAHLTLKAMMDFKNLQSLTSISSDEAEDISNARYLNLIFNDPLIESFCDNYLELSRSVTTQADRKNFVSVIADMVGRSFVQPPANQGLMASIMGRR